MSIWISASVWLLFKISAFTPVTTATLENFSVKTVRYGGMPGPLLDNGTTCSEIIEQVVEPSKIITTTRCSPNSFGNENKVMYRKEIPLSIKTALDLVTKINAVLVGEVSHSDVGESSHADDYIAEVSIVVGVTQVTVSGLRQSRTISDALKNLLSLLETISFST